jgi:polyhydroxyalkanoate synthase
LIQRGADLSEEKVLGKEPWSHVDFSTQKYDPLGLAKGLLEVVEEFQKATHNLTPSEQPTNYLKGFSLFDPWDMYRSLMQAGQKILENPDPFYQATYKYASNVSQLWQQTLTSSATSETLPPVITPELGDRRFKDKDWTEQPYFNFLQQSYLLWNRWILDVTDNIQDVDKDTARKIQFYVRQFRDALAPTNFFWMNPTTLRRTLETKGSNVLAGIENFLKDLEKGQGQLDIQMVDPEAFAVGKNIATTPGKVVYQNELVQLIQYAPTTKEVYRIPLLIVPPCINKYYVFDLRPDTSFVRWFLDHGYTVFIVSWVNPDQKLANKTFEDYVIEGLLDAIKAIQKILNVDEINAMGFCIGGNFLSVLNGYLHTLKEKNPLKSTTYLATLFDFQDSGDLRVFIDEPQIANLEKQIQTQGYLEGKTLARTFNLLRANDLIWSFIINNYYLGEKPASFDLLYWNSDSTNLPSAMYLYYLKMMYIENKLIQPGGLTVAGNPIDLSKIKTPTFVMNTKEDHIAPWHCGYAGAKIHGGPTTFLLGGSGHIAGIINHPDAKKYAYWMNDELPKSPTDWLKDAKEYPGSWWETWEKWLRPFSGEKVPARKPGTKTFPVLEDAPGSYVKK